MERVPVSLCHRGVCFIHLKDSDLVEVHINAPAGLCLARELSLCEHTADKPWHACAG